MFGGRDPRAVLPEPYFYNIGYYPDRDFYFDSVMRLIKECIDSGMDVFVHCHGGRHRAALMFCLVVMLGLTISFALAREVLGNS